jgi:TolB-like protein
MLFSVAVLGIIFAPAILKQAGKRETAALPPSASTTPSAAAIPAKSIAVLPFENLSRDPDNAFFTDGIQDEILTNLARIAELKVISRTSVMQYKSGSARNLREIGRQLAVAHVLEGSIQFRHEQHDVQHRVYVHWCIENEASQLKPQEHAYHL